MQHAEDSALSPPVSAGDSFEPLAAKARGAMRIAAMIRCAFLLFPVGMACLIAVRKFDIGLLAGLGLFLLGAIIALGFGWWFGGASWRHAGVALDERGIAIRRGVWFRSETFVPRSRVQHTDINRGPIERWLGLASLKLYTAGTRLASVQVEGLTHDRATSLRDALVSHDDDAI